jgi:lipopolysaccharide export system protein LptA
LKTALHILIVQFIIISCGICYGQKQIRILHADEGTSHPEYQNTHILSGNVSFEHDSTYMTCDSAYFFLDSNSFYAFSKVIVTRGDSIKLTGDTVIYRGTERNADLYGNIVYTDRKMKMITPKLHYEFTSQIGSYSSGAIITSMEDKNTLFSKQGTYHSDQQTMYFKDSVRLENEEYTMESDTLIYNINTETSQFEGPTTILSADNTIYCEQGWYDSKNETSSLSQNASLFTKEQKLYGDRIHYQRNIGIGEVFGNVFFVDTTNKIELTSDFAFHNEFIDSTALVGNAIMSQVFENDTLFLKSEEININRDSTGKKNNIKAYHSVQIFKSDFQGVCDSLTYSDNDSLMKFYESPILWSEESQITGDFIQARTSSLGIEKMNIIKNAFIISKIDSINFDQIKGKNIDAFFDSTQINLVEVTGNGQALYYILNEDSLYLEGNQAKCANLNIYFKKGEINSIKLLDAPTAKYQSIEDFSEEERYFAGFKWHKGLRPQRIDFIRERKD